MLSCRHDHSYHEVSCETRMSTVPQSSRRSHRLDLHGAFMAPSRKPSRNLPWNLYGNLHGTCRTFAEPSWNPWGLSREVDCNRHNGNGNVNIMLSWSRRGTFMVAFMATFIEYLLHIHGTFMGTLLEASWQPSSCLHHGYRHGIPWNIRWDGVCWEPSRTPWQPSPRCRFRFHGGWA